MFFNFICDFPIHFLGFTKYIKITYNKRFHFLTKISNYLILNFRNSITFYNKINFLNTLVFTIIIIITKQAENNPFGKIQSLLKLKPLEGI